MLTHHEPSIIEVDFASLSPEQRATVVQNAIRRAHAERSKAIGAMAKRLIGFLAFRRGSRGGNASTLGTPA
ncbi:MAG: hypothetical protein ACKVP3_10230 [Hyphomicrobiaceae bacterium]